MDDEIAVKFDIKNTGKTNGAEVVQLYIGKTSSSVLRPKKELKAFDKIFLGAGEQKTVDMKVKVKDLAFYDEKTSSWKIEQGEYILYTATSVNDVMSTTTVTIQ